jgi:hypothetical protein
VRLLFDLLSSCSGHLKHAAATTPAAVTVPTLTLNALQSCTRYTINRTDPIIGVK